MWGKYYLIQLPSLGKLGEPPQAIAIFCGKQTVLKSMQMHPRKQSFSYRVIYLTGPPQFQYQKENRQAANHSTGLIGTAAVIG